MIFYCIVKILLLFIRLVVNSFNGVHNFFIVKDLFFFINLVTHGRQESNPKFEGKLKNIVDSRKISLTQDIHGGYCALATNIRFWAHSPFLTSNPLPLLSYQILMEN